SCLSESTATLSPGSMYSEINQNAHNNQDLVSSLGSLKQSTRAMTRDPRPIVVVIPKNPLPQNRGHTRDQTKIGTTTVHRPPASPSANGTVDRPLSLSPAWSWRS